MSACHGKRSVKGVVCLYLRVCANAFVINVAYSRSSGVNTNYNMYNKTHRIYDLQVALLFQRGYNFICSGAHMIGSYDLLFVLSPERRHSTYKIV